MPDGRLLTLVRHAKSSWDNPDLIDFDRPLSPRGIRDAPRMAEWLLTRVPPPGHWITSPARRARATALAFARVFRIPAGRIRNEPELYLADEPEWLGVIRAIPAVIPHAICFGHNPGLERAVAWLTGDKPGKLPTCAVVHLRLAGTWLETRAGCAALAWRRRPRDLAQS